MTTMDLNNSIVKIVIYTDKLFEHFVTYYCTSYTQYDLNFKIYLKPETVKYNQTIINQYSKTCKAVFGNSKCQIDKALYSGIYNNVKEMLKASLKIKKTAIMTEVELYSAKIILAVQF
ncbi:hypothetical protein [Rickettsia akari]|nr:hypothetical protein [Rickettsia akari]